MRWPDLDLDAARGVLDACTATLTVQGSRKIGAAEQHALRTIATTLLRHEMEPDPHARVPRDLADRLPDDELRDHAVVLLVLCAVIDGRIDVDRLAVVARIATALGRERAIVGDLARIAEHRVLHARFCILRRAVRDLFHRSLWQAMGDLFASSVHGDEGLLQRYRGLETLPEGTFGRALFAFYEDNLFRLPGEPGPIPPSFGVLHDARHVLSGWDGSYHGEVRLAAFESGLARRGQIDNLMAVVLHCHLGVEILEPYIPVQQSPVDVAALAAEMARGAAADPVLLHPGWDFWALCDRPIAEVRATLGIAPGGSVLADTRWCGPDGLGMRPLPIDRVTRLPETDQHLVALRVTGPLTRPDIETVGDLVARRTWNGRRIDLLLDLEPDAGYDDATALIADMQLALRFRHGFRRVAVVSPSRWVQAAVALDAPVARWFGVGARTFPPDRREAALAFLRQ